MKLSTPLWQLLAPGGSRGRLWVMIFHRVLPAPDLLAPHEPTAESFEQLLRWLRERFNFVALADAIDALRKGTLPARSVAITFDDGYADNADVALPVLEKLGIPATFFVATGFLDGGRMWNDTIIETVRAAGEELDLSDLDLGKHRFSSAEDRLQCIRSLLGAVKHRDPTVRTTTVNAIARAASAPLPDDLMMTTEQLRKLARAGMEIGGHTVTHPILTSVSPGVARDEIATNRVTLERITGRPVRLFAYPNGRPRSDYGEEHVRAVRELGFAAAVSTSPGVADAGTDPYQIPRFTPWATSGLRLGVQIGRNLATTRTEYA
jgi:peptidoglycan/xylan/chitin deacetylase (PgdA/CDA1 family)